MLFRYVCRSQASPSSHRTALCCAGEESLNARDLAALDGMTEALQQTRQTEADIPFSTQTFREGGIW